MNTGLNNIEHPAPYAFSAKASPRVGVEWFFTSMLGYGKIVILLADLLLLNLCLCFSGIALMGIDWTFSVEYLSGMIYFSLLWVFLSYLRGIHKDLLLIDTVEVFRTLSKVFFVFVVCSWFFILILLDGYNNMSRFLYFVCLFYLLFGLTVVSNRVLLLSIRMQYKDKIRKKKNIFIIGDSSSCEMLENYIEENQCDLRLQGFFYNGYEPPVDFGPYTTGYDKHAAMQPSTDIEAYEAALGGYGEVSEAVAAIAAPAEVRAAAKTLQNAAAMSTESHPPLRPGYQNKGIDRDRDRDRNYGKVIRGRVLDCVKYFGQLPIDEIYCSLQSMEEKSARYLIKEADKHMIRIKFLPDFYQILRRRSTIHYLGTVPVLSIREEPLTLDSNIIVKRVFDFCFALFVIVFILSWLTLIIGLLIKLESRGPIFFKQDRSGINNKTFKVYKFRSMQKVKGIGEDSQAVKDDVRLTKIGAFLRKTSLDELPQFVNVLMGVMTVVGPRPHMLSHTDKFSKEVDTYMVRHLAKPGITGWAQVNGCRGETRTREAIEERVQHDVWYIENWSLTLDLKIIFLTVWNIFRGEENAY